MGGGGGVRGAGGLARCVVGQGAVGLAVRGRRWGGRMAVRAGRGKPAERETRPGGVMSWHGRVALVLCGERGAGHCALDPARVRRGVRG